MSTNEQITTLPATTREGWGPGPWDGEPDRVLWREDGLVCLARRAMSMGAWCGYVGVPEDHPWHGRSYGDLSRVAVHGGLTYSKACSHDLVMGCQYGICHTPEPGEPDDLWWLGFDCGHAEDRVPNEYAPEPWQRMMGGADDLGGGETYRDLAFVKAEIQRLVQQARAAETGGAS